MKKIQIQTQKLDEQLDVQELATLTIQMWKYTRPELSPTVERFRNWIKNLKYEHTPVIVKAIKEGKLVGWTLLFIHDSNRLEINPWALGGHPHIAYNDPDKVNITKLILQECKNYALQNNYTRVEFCFEPKDDVKEYPIYPFIYPECNFPKINELVYMTRDLDENDDYSPQPELPESVKTVLVKDTNDEDLYSCFNDSFSEGGDRYILSLPVEERKEYFDSYYNRTDEMIDESSIALVKGTKIIGFTFVRPTHGEGNGNIAGICVLPEYRGKHLGSYLLNHVIMSLKKLGYKSASLGVDLKNEVAVKLYEKHEFIKEWRRIYHAWKRGMEGK